MSFWQLPAHPEDAALVKDGGTLSYADLGCLADGIPTLLPTCSRKSFGFLIFAHEPFFVAAYLGMLRSARYAPLLLHPTVPPRVLAELIARFAPDWIIAPSNIQIPESFAIRWEEGAARLLVPRHAQESPAPHDDLAILLLTSGSSGSSKLVRLSYRALSTNAQAISSYLGLDRTDRAITTLPLSYAFGLSILNSHLAARGSVVLSQESIVTRAFWEIASEAEITSLSGVPATYEMLRKSALEERGLTKLRMLTVAGGRLRPDLAAHFHDLGRRQGWQLYLMYGQTEAAPRISYVPPASLPAKINSIGIPIPGGELRADPASGELIYAGPNVMMGYAESREDLSRDDEVLGVLRTGDLATQDEDGFWYLEGRLSRIIKVSGVRHNLDAIEQALSQSFRCQIVATGEDDALCITTASAGAPSASAVKAGIKELFNIHGTYVTVCERDSLPFLPNGKIDHRSLRAIA